MRLTWEQIHKDSNPFCLKFIWLFSVISYGFIIYRLWWCLVISKTRQFIFSQGSPLTTLSSKRNLSLICFLSPSSYWNPYYNSEIVLSHSSGVFSLVIPDKTLANISLSYLTLEAIDLSSTNVQE